MELMREKGCNPNVFSYSTLMGGFVKSGSDEELWSETWYGCLYNFD